MVEAQRIREIVDFRHDDGVNWYLVKEKRTGEMSWIVEDNLPDGLETALKRIREKKAIFAKSRVFGEKAASKPARRVTIATEAVKTDPGSSDASSSDDSDSSTSSGVLLKGEKSGVLSTSAKLQKSIGGLVKPSKETRSIADALANSVGCRALKVLTDLLGSDEDRRMNDIFVEILYGSKATRGLSAWHRELLDLLWTGAIQDRASEDRLAILESLCSLGHRMNSFDAVTARAFDEFVSEATMSFEEITSANFRLFSKLCEIGIEVRLKGLDSLPVFQEAGLVDEEMKMAEEGEEEGQGNKKGDLTEKRFSYVEKDQVELEDAEIVDLIYRIYREKNPDKLCDVPGIVEKYKSQLSTLFVTLMKKYSVDFDSLGTGKIFVPLELKGKKLKERLAHIFIVHEPSRLVDVDEIVSYYLSRPSEETASYVAKLERSYCKIYHASSPSSSSLLSSDSFGFRALIAEALSVGNPDRLADLDAILTKYRGKENFAYLAVCDKYNLAVNEAGFTAAEKRRCDFAESQRKKGMKEILEAVYARHNPSKVQEVSKLAEKYNVWELFELIVKKYSIPLSEKLEYLFSSGSVWAHQSEMEFPDALKESVKALNLALELERLSHQGVIKTGTPGQFLQAFWNPTTAFGSLVSAEMIVQAKSAVYHGHGPAGSTQSGAQLEAQLRDLVENRVNSTLRKLGKDLLVRVTAQEPEYLAGDAFAIGETGRISCVVSIYGQEGVVGSILTSLSENFIQNGTEFDQDVSNPILTGPGAFRAHSILKSETGAVLFVGDFRALIDSEAVNHSPSLYRSRLAVWANVKSEDCKKVVEKCMRFPRSLRKCSLAIDEHAQTVSVIGTCKHRTAFKETVALIKRILTSSEDPYLSMRIPKHLCHGGKPAMALAPQVYEWSDVSYHESGDDVDSAVEEQEGPSETARPLKLTRVNMRDFYLQGQLCLNCDQTTHKPPECPIKRKVCWNCHGAHTGAACTYPCRFCKGKHTWGILECVKKGAKRFADWVKSRSYAEEKGLGAMVDEVVSRLRSNGWNFTDPAVAGSVKSLAQLGVAVDLAVEMAKQDGLFLASCEGEMSNNSFLPPRPVVPSENPPALPDSKYPWCERVWLDELLSPSLMGRDPLRLLMAQKGTSLKQIEIRENCKILFRGSSAKEIFGSDNMSSGSNAPLQADTSCAAVDIRFHAVVMCDSPLQALSIKQGLIELINQVQTAVDEGAVARPQAVEGFSFLEKVPILNDNIAQFDFLNVNNGAPIELDLKDHFEHIGDLRHWLHQRGVEVELGDDNSVRLPATGKILDAVDARCESTAPQVDAQHVEVFNAFFHLVSFWVNTPPVTGGQYWFEPFELKPEGLIGLTEYKVNGNIYENGQVVSLSEIGVNHFTSLLTQCHFVSQEIDPAKLKSILSRFRGVVRTVARDVRLLMYLKHPWALSSSTGTVARDVPEDFGQVEAFKSVLNPTTLRECGRIGVSSAGFDAIDTNPEIIQKQLAPFESGDQDISSLVPGEGLLKRLAFDNVPETEMPYTGYVVDWIAPKDVTDFVSGLSDLAAAAVMEDEPLAILPVPVDTVKPNDYALDLESPSEEDLSTIPVTELKERLKAKGLAVTGRKADLIDRLHADSKQTSSNIPKKTYKCRVELPKALMKWSELNNNLTGPNNSHFKHIRIQCPSATLICQGSASAALVGEARLHVQLTATDPNDYRKAKSLAEDLVKAVAEVGADICLADESATVRAAAMKEVKVVGVEEP